MEKYIERGFSQDNKGYKEQIVDIAVAYQIDSKYTAFIAVNERDEKLTDIPLLEDTILETPAGWDLDMDIDMLSNNFIPPSSRFRRLSENKVMNDVFSDEMLTTEKSIADKPISKRKSKYLIVWLLFIILIVLILLYLIF